MASLPNPKLTYVRPVRPLHFPESEPEEEHLGQHPRHWDLCVALVNVLRAVCGEANAVAGDMFVYWVATVNDDRGRRAPDAAVKLGLMQSELVQHGSWKTWEFGVPELVVEVLSLSDTRERWTLTEKREAYEAMGVREFVCFDVDAPEGKRVRVWDRVDGDFVERVVEDERTPCVTLSHAFGVSLDWTVAAAGRWSASLRVLKDGALVLMPEEAALAAQAREAAAMSREAEANAREAVAKQGEADARASEAAAHARVRELEALLAQATAKR
ncbi:MAG: Uma2 family endonuclease [Myxococcales bacterium]|nr:Uma2 family endonuclease [Myxococcales bacterium]